MSGDGNMISLSDIVELKKELKDIYGVELHFHDVCPKPYFTLDRKDESVKNYISDFLRNKSLKAVFSKDDTHFTVERNKYA